MVTNVVHRREKVCYVRKQLDVDPTRTLRRCVDQPTAGEPYKFRERSTRIVSHFQEQYSPRHHYYYASRVTGKNVPA